MAQIAGTYSTYDLVGDREDLIEPITMISPTKTPFTNLSGRAKATNTLHEWQTDELAAAADNKHIEGDETTFSAPTATTRLNNQTQIFKKSVIVTGTARAIKTAGRKDELAYQIMKITKEIARDVEFSLMQKTAAVAGNDTTARELKGVAGFITTNQTDKAAAAIVQADIEKTSQDVWTAGGDPGHIMCGAFNKRQISGFVTGVTKNLDAKDKKLMHNVDVFETDFGIMQVIPNRFQLADDVYELDMSLWKIAVLRSLRIEELAKTGDADKRHMLTELTLECLQEKGNGSIINTTTA